MGGIALGKAVESSGLLKTIASQIETAVTGFSAFQVLFVFSCLVLVIATFISHTVAALIVLPIVAEVGSQLANPQPRMLVMVNIFLRLYFFMRSKLINIDIYQLGNRICMLCCNGSSCIWIP
jgi:phosphate transporter